MTISESPLSATPPILCDKMLQSVSDFVGSCPLQSHGLDEKNQVFSQETNPFGRHVTCSRIHLTPTC